MPIGLPADATALRGNSTWFLIYGIAMIVLGILAILMPGLATLTVELMVGWLLLLGGAMGLFTAFSNRAMPGLWWNLLTSIVFVLAGLALLTRPMAGIITLTIILAAYLLAGGIVRIFQSFAFRTAIPNAWIWMLFSGVIDVVLAFIIMSGMPGTAVWVLGLMVGINLLMMGVAISMAALAIRKAAR